MNAFLSGYSFLFLWFAKKGGEGYEGKEKKGGTEQWRLSLFLVLSRKLFSFLFIVSLKKGGFRRLHCSFILLFIVFENCYIDISG